MSRTKDFENKLKRLEEIVEKLENGERPLEETVALFQEGMKLSKECRKTLAAVEQSVTKVIGETEDGEPETEKFRVEDDPS